MKCSLYLYFGKIKIYGLEHVPLDKPVLFLPNHQSALMDVLLLAVDCNRKPFFLTRSDVFGNPMLKRLFTYLRMLPVYRIRDGRQSLKYNDEIFELCAELLGKGEAIMIFPEANHSLKRKVRPLSKGFTRILFRAIDQSPELDIRMVPIGINYRSAEAFPDRVAIYVGENIPLRNLYDIENVMASTTRVKEAVSEKLKLLTTHIEDDLDHDRIIGQLDALGADYLKPSAVNTTIDQLGHPKVKTSFRKVEGPIKTGFRFLFTILNLPLVLSWRALLKPKVWEPEFMATMRFAYALMVTPLYFLILFLTLGNVFNPLIALATVGILFVFNLLYVKLG